MASSARNRANLQLASTSAFAQSLSRRCDIRTARDFRSTVETPRRSTTQDCVQPLEHLHASDPARARFGATKHALTQEVTYKSLPLEARRRHHERIAQALETSFADRLDEKSELLGHHYQQAGNIEKALEHLLRTAQRATARFASIEALGYCAAVVECLDRFFLRRTSGRGSGSTSASPKWR
jgi:predicted ATPase